MRYALVLSLLLAACGGSQQAGTRSITLRMQGPDCRMTCSAQLHPGEVVTDCTPPLEFDPGKRDPSITVCFFGPARPAEGAPALGTATADAAAAPSAK